MQLRWLAMSEVGQVIPYAEAVRPRGGMRIGTMLALYGIAAAGLELAEGRNLAQMLARITQSSTPSAGMIALEWLFLAATVCTLIGAGLLLFRRAVGAMEGG